MGTLSSMGKQHHSYDPRLLICSWGRGGASLEICEKNLDWNFCPTPIFLDYNAINFGDSKSKLLRLSWLVSRSVCIRWGPRCPEPDTAEREKDSLIVSWGRREESVIFCPKFGLFYVPQWTHRAQNWKNWSTSKIDFILSTSLSLIREKFANVNGVIVRRYQSSRI